MLYLFGLALASGFGVAFAAFGCGLGQARAVAAALEGAARQPEAAGRLTTLMILGLAFIESLTLYAFVLGLILSTKLGPYTPEIVLKLAGR